MRKIKERKEHQETDELTVKLGDFVLWAEDKTTKTIFKYFEHCLNQYKEIRCSPDLVRDPNGQLKMNYYLGCETVLLDLLNIRETIVEVEDE